jgi:GxGYxYP putative glycoside hydrolase C-terminal domain/GxGYxY sequence motif in domain of unknown function N-terminal
MLPAMPAGGDRAPRSGHRRAALAALLALLCGLCPGTLSATAEPRRLDVVDVDPARCGCGGDDALMLGTLEGVVNRDSPRLFLIEPSGGAPDEPRGAWLDDLGLPWSRIGEWDAVARYRARLRGIVEYDPAVPATIDVATAIAGLRDAVVAGPATATRLRAMGLPVLVDLAALHLAGTEDAYRWALTNVWPHTTHRVLVGMLPAADGMLRDYAVAQRAMVVWLDPTVPGEAALLDRYLRDLPPDSPYLGWFPGDVRGEHDGVLQLSRHAVYTVAADRFSNLTVLSAVRAPSSPLPPAAAPPLENRIYVTVTVTDGDNLQYDEHRLRILWDDPARGSVPLNWTVQPLLVDAAPVILRHYQTTATARDMLLAGPSGAGYAYPDAWPRDELRAFTRRTGDAMRAAGLRSLVLYHSPAAQLRYDGAVARAFAADVAPDGVDVDQSDSGMTMVVGHTAVVSGPVECAADLPGRIAALSQGWDGTSPRFISLSAIAWCSTPTELAGVLGALDGRYRAVRADQLFELVRRARPRQ